MLCWNYYKGGQQRLEDDADWLRLFGCIISAERRTESGYSCPLKALM